MLWIDGFFIIIARGSKIIPISFPAIDIHSPSGREEIKKKEKSSLRIINLVEKNILLFSVKHQA